MGRYFEEIYQLYRENLKNQEEEIMELAKEFGLTFYNDYKNNRQPEFGDIFFFYYQGVPVYYLFLEKEDDFYKVLKVSNFWRLANQNDLIVEIDDEKYIVQPWNIFYLNEGEYQKSVYIGSLNEEDKNILKDFIEGKLKELPKNKRGLTVPEGDLNFFQNKFHKDEALLVKDLALRIFNILEKEDNIISLPPERLKEQPLAAGREKTTYTGKNFVLFFDRENKIITLEPIKEIIGKPAVIRIFDEEYETESLPEKIMLEIPDEIQQVNLDYIGTNIKIEVKS